LRETVEAFISLKQNEYKFVICGTGDSDDWLKKVSKENENVIFLGVVDYKKAIYLQRNAAVLINPRRNDGEYTQYSFPSKTMEYLLAGKPVIGYVLDGMPSEYSQFLISPKDNSMAELANTLRNVFSMSYQERKKTGQAGKEYVISKKTPKAQGKKIVEMIEQIHVQV
jgi:glycosyltransferase involved in cell wall biosynthesis